MPKVSHTLNHSDEPIRLFQSDFLEFFTHISPLAVLVLWLPAIGVCLWLAWQVRLAGSLSWSGLLGGYLAGLFVWTLIEYLLHRFLFHFHPRNASPALERIIFLFHGVHHAQPQLKTRLVMPPVVSLPLALIIYGLFWQATGLVGARRLLYPLMAGMLSGYLAYDMIHYATHHFAMREGVWKFLKRYHMAHHFKDPNAKYGVSSPLWDYVFRTA